MDIKQPEDFDTEKEMLDYLINTGSIVWMDLDENNQPLYQTNVELCELYAPWYLKEVYRDIDDDIVKMIEAGLLQVGGMDEFGEMYFELTDEARANFEDQE